MLWMLYVYIILPNVRPFTLPGLGCIYTIWCNMRISKIDNRCVVQLYGYTHAFHRLHFTEYWMYNFEIRVGESKELGHNDVCHKQLDFMDSLQANITCSRELYGDWVSINSTDTEYVAEILAFLEVRVFRRGKDGYKRKWIYIYIFIKYNCKTKRETLNVGIWWDLH